MAEIVTIDHKLRVDLKHLCDVLKEEEENAKRMCITEAPHFQIPHGPVLPHYQPLGPSTIPNTAAPQQFRPTGANAVHQSNHHSFPPSNSSGNAYQQSSQQRCPPLMPDEINLLNKHKGCRKCWCFYMGHRVATCPHGFPDGATYCMLTEDMAITAMQKLAVASMYSDPSFANNSTSSSVFHPSDFNFNMPRASDCNTTSTSSFSSSYNSYIAPAPITYSTPIATGPVIVSTHIEESSATRTTAPTTIAAILLSSSMQPFVLGDGKSDTSSSTDNVSELGPVSILFGKPLYGTVRTNRFLYWMMVLTSP